MDSQHIKPTLPEDEKIIYNKELNIWEALVPVVVLVALLALNVKYINGGVDDDPLNGSNQFILLLGAAAAVIVGIFNKVSFSAMLENVGDNIKSTFSAILILMMVGALSGTWFISGIVPAMIYYGVQILDPTYFLAACVIICALVSVATGSSWTTSATVGIALIGIAGALNISLAMTAGAVISGAYFGDKMSPMSDTTNLAPAMAGTDLITHIKYMSYTTIPSIFITLLIFLIIGFSLPEHTASAGQIDIILKEIEGKFHITGWLFLVPLVVIVLIVLKKPPLVALFVGALLGGVFAIVFQPNVVFEVSGMTTDDAIAQIRGVMNAITADVSLPISDSLSSLNENYSSLFSSGGMIGMLNTIFLILCAMVFGGVMEAIGALERITESLLKVFHSVLGLFASTVASCLVLNFTASDQYLAIVVPGKMYANAFKKKGLAPENLSRTLEDSGTVTSVLIPWNTCGAYQSGVLNVPAEQYFMYAFFNIISPIMTLIFAAFGIKIKQLVQKSS